MNKKYTTLLFDVDDTLLDFGKAEDNAVTKLFGSYDIPLTDENKKRYVEHNRSLWKKLEKKEITREQLFKIRFTEFFGMMGVEADGEKANAEFISYIAEGSFLMDGALEVCRELHENHKIYLITNGSKKAQRGRLNGSPLMEYIDGVFISEKIGFVKPQKEFFDYVLSQIDEKDKSKLLVIGDSLSSDIKGASDYGIDSCWVSAGADNDSPATYHIGKITKLTDIVR